MSTLYDVLQVPRDADAGLIKAAWRSQAKTTHPDVGGRADAFARLEEAYRTLADPALRAAYDRKLESIPVDDAEPLDDGFTLVEDEVLNNAFVSDPQSSRDPYVRSWLPWMISRKGARRTRPTFVVDSMLVGLLAVCFSGAVTLLVWAVRLHSGWSPPPQPPFIVTRELYDAAMTLFGAVEIAAVLSVSSILLHGTILERWLRKRNLSRLLVGATIASGVACTLWLIVPLAIVILSLILWFFAGMAALWVFGSVIGATAGGSGAG